jgi:hypothetical protein
MLKLRLAVFFCCLFAVMPVHAEDIAKRDWSANGKPSLIVHAPAKTDVETFVSETLGSDWNIKTCDYGFADIGHDGIFRLLAALDGNGKHFCNRIVVIGKTDGKISVLNDFKVEGVEDIHKILYEDKGGTVMVFPEGWGFSDGGGCRATWLRVYQWQAGPNGQFTARDKAFPDIYKGRLKQLAAALSKLQEPSCAQMEADRITRFLGIEPKAGYVRALEWMRSQSGSLRRKAAAVFADIGDDDSEKNLVLLENDPDPLVAEAAKVYRDSATPDSKE